jgi:hypothetical protein
MTQRTAMIITDELSDAIVDVMRREKTLVSEDWPTLGRKIIESLFKNNPESCGLLASYYEDLQTIEIPFRVSSE